MGSDLELPPLLPVFALAAFAAAAFAAFLAFNMRAPSPDRVGPWDVAGALVFLGCAASMLGEVTDLIEFLRPVQPRKQEPAGG